MYRTITPENLKPVKIRELCERKRHRDVGSGFVVPSLLFHGRRHWNFSVNQNSFFSFIEHRFIRECCQAEVEPVAVAIFLRNSAKPILPKEKKNPAPARTKRNEKRRTRKKIKKWATQKPDEGSKWGASWSRRPQGKLSSSVDVHRRQGDVQEEPWADQSTKGGGGRKKKREEAWRNFFLPKKDHENRCNRAIDWAIINSGYPIALPCAWMSSGWIEIIVFFNGKNFRGSSGSIPVEGGGRGGRSEQSIGTAESVNSTVNDSDERNRRREMADN